MPKIKIILYGFTFYMFFSSCNLDFGCEKYINEKIKPLKIDGTVVAVYENEKNHYMPYIKYRNKHGADTSILLSGYDMSDITSYLKSGDSLFKEVDSLKVEVFRDTTRTTFVVRCQ
jgi:hypothetical protein